MSCDQPQVTRSGAHTHDFAVLSPTSDAQNDTPVRADRPGKHAK